MMLTPFQIILNMVEAGFDVIHLTILMSIGWITHPYIVKYIYKI